ncbi:MAG TPA: hypothetical protein VLQ45_14440, partial [Thermoanaerobaculia bacterium]|nr:hypothetical protein [Thermoanaerobaculia bacterium]
MKVFFLSFWLCVAALGHSRPGLADSSAPAPEALLNDLQKQGWTEVSPGVMQRSLGGNRIETLGFGAAGLRFQLQEMEAHLVDLREEYAQHPSRQLRITIRAHRAQILRVEEALEKARTTEDGLEISAEGLIVQGPNCAVSYDASAVAFPLAQGAGSKATAFFNNACGYIGEVYAHSKSRAVAADNSVTLNTQSDPALDTPRIGTNVSAGASTSANGVKECDSYAYASVVNYDLEITYAQSDQNYACAENLPSPWADTDVGAVGPAGGASYDNGAFRLIAGGSDLAGTADAFHFVHLPLTGDGTIVANVAALLKPVGANRTLAGVTFRNDLTAGSAHATMTITSEGEAKFRRRVLANSTTASDGTATTFAPQWLKLVRSGNVFTAYLSANGTVWTQVHTPQTVAMSGTVYVGLVALRNGAGTPTGAARFENVSMTPQATAPPPGIVEGNLVVKGASCIGAACSDTDSNYSALKLKSAQPNILFDDIALPASGETASHDWALLINPSNVNQFSIQDHTNGLIPFTVSAGAPNNSLYIAANGGIGIGTTSPTFRFHLFENTDTNTVLRIENPHTGALTAAALNVLSDTGHMSFIAHASPRTLSRFGKTLGGWTEILSISGNGLAIGTYGAVPLVLGTNNTNRMEIGGNGGVTINGNFTVTGGTKNFAVVDPADSQRAIYFAALEGPEAGTYFRGTARLKDGEAVIELPGYFTRVTEPERLTVQLTLVGHWGQIYVAEKSAERLVIRAAPGTADLEFDFLVQGVRKGYLDFEVERPNTLP